MSLILAWKSEEAKSKALDKHGFKAKQYLDRPVRKHHWKEVRNHPISGLAQFEIKEPEK